MLNFRWIQDFKFTSYVVTKLIEPSGFCLQVTVILQDSLVNSEISLGINNWPSYIGCFEEFQKKAILSRDQFFDTVVVPVDGSFDMSEAPTLTAPPTTASTVLQKGIKMPVQSTQMASCK